MAKRALTIGIWGRDRADPSKLLLNKIYEMIGILRRSSRAGVADHWWRWLGNLDRVLPADDDLLDSSSLCRIVAARQPNEIYSFAAQSRVTASSHPPVLTTNETAVDGYERLRRSPRVVWHPLQPRQPATQLGTRDAESQGDDVARIERGLTPPAAAGNTNADCDRGHAADCVRAIWLMLRQDKANGYAVSTGQTASANDMCRIAYAHVDLDTDSPLVLDPTLERPVEIDELLGNPAKAETAIGRASKIDLETMIMEMVDADFARLRSTK